MTEGNTKLGIAKMLNKYRKESETSGKIRRNNLTGFKNVMKTHLRKIKSHKDKK